MRLTRYHATALILALTPLATLQAQDDAGQTDTNARSMEDLDYDDIYQQGGIRGRNLLGAEVFGTEDGEIGNVRDAIVSEQDDQIVALIAEVGGFWDMGDTHVAVPWDKVELTEDGVKVPVNEDNAEDYDLYEGEFSVAKQDLSEIRELDDDDMETGDRSWKLSELINDYASIGDDTGYGYVNDVLFSKEGKVQGIVVETADDRYGRGYYAFPFYSYGNGWSPNMRSYRIPSALEDVKKVPNFDYEQYQGLWDE